MVVSRLFWPPAFAGLADGVRIVEPHPGRATRRWPQHQRVADAVRALRRRFDSPDGKLHHDSGSRFENGAIEAKQKFPLWFIHKLTYHVKI